MLDIDPAALGETAEQAELRAVLRDFFAATSSPDDVRKHLATPRGFDETLWSRLAGEIGVPGLAIPAEFGGAGFSFAELAVAIGEAGRALACTPLLSTTVLAGHALLLSGDQVACRRYLPALAAGTRTATVAGFESGGLTAGPGAGGWAGSGQADFVLDGAGADVVVLAASTGSGPGLFACEAGAPGLTRQPRAVLDGTRPQALVTLRETPLTPVGAPGEAAGVVARVLDIGRAALAVEQVGGSAHALEATIAYVGQRHQFGRPVGSFQAVQHRLADLLVEVEAARSAAAYAVACVDGAPAELAVAAGVAQVVCSETYRRAAEEYVQLHGGIGFTWEHPAHLYLRRARSAEVLFGTADDHRRRLAGLLGLTT